MTLCIRLSLDMEPLSWRGPLKGLLASECTVLWDLLIGFKFEELNIKFLIPKWKIILNNHLFSAIIDGPMPLPVNRMQVSQGI